MIQTVPARDPVDPTTETSAEMTEGALSTRQPGPARPLGGLGRHKAVFVSALLVIGCHGMKVGPEGRGVPPFPPAPAPDEIRSRLVLVGDPGESDFVDVVPLLHESFVGVEDRTAVAFLGDLIYPSGIRVGHHGETEDRRRQESQVAAVVDGGGPKPTALFIPGNHDWESDFEGITAQRDLVEARGALWLPQDLGCPGPEVYEGLDGFLLVILDTEWFIDDHPDEMCPGTTQEQVADSLQALLATNAQTGRQAVLLGHHPIRSDGRHGGACDAYLCLYRLFKATEAYLFHHGDEQDLNHMRNRVMRAWLNGAMAPNRPLLFAAGHDHSLLVFEHEDGEGPLFSVVSGSAGKVSEVRNGASLYAHGQRGFMTVDLTFAGGVFLTVWGTEVNPGFTCWMRLDSGAGANCPAATTP
jgi:hypothetical protein